jgi:hypothetical protein
MRPVGNDFFRLFGESAVYTRGQNCTGEETVMDLRFLAVPVIAALCMIPIGRPADWTRYQPEGCTISIELPGRPIKLDAGEFAKPDGVMSSPVHYQCHYDDSSVTLFEATLMRDNPEVWREISSGFCDGMALGLEKTGGAAVNRSVSQTTFLGQPAHEIRFRIERGEASLSVIGYCFYEHSRMHAVCGVYSPRNEDSLRTVKRVFESIKLTAKESSAQAKVTSKP